MSQGDSNEPQRQEGARESAINQEPALSQRARSEKQIKGQ